MQHTLMRVFFSGNLTAKASQQIVDFLEKQQPIITDARFSQWLMVVYKTSNSKIGDIQWNQFAGLESF